jgi:hypothetical protein
MSKIFVWLQLIFFVLLLIYATYNLFKGRFEQSLLIFPIFAVYYVFVIARNKRAFSDSEKEDQ